MIQLLDLSSVVDRIATECPSYGFRAFLTLPPSDENTLVEFFALHDSPTAFVYLEDDKSDDNRIKGGVRQKMTSVIVVETVVRRIDDINDRYHEALVQKIRQYRMEHITALAGWPLPGSVKPLQHVAGELSLLGDRAVKWRDRFSTDSLIV